MANVTVSSQVAAPLQETFDVFTAIEKSEERIPAITKLEMLSEGPFGNGTRWRETRLMMKKEATEEMWVTGFDPPKSYTVEAQSHGSLYQTLFTFEPSGSGTQVTWSFDATAQSFFAKVTSPIFGLLFKGMMRKCMLEDLEALRDVCEGKAPAGSQS